MGGQPFKDHLADEFLDKKLPNICRNSESLEEARLKAELLRKTGYGHVCSKETLNDYMEDCWNTTWEKYNGC